MTQEEEQILHLNPLGFNLQYMGGLITGSNNPGPNNQGHAGVWLLCDRERYGYRAGIRAEKEYLVGENIMDKLFCNF